MEIKIGSFVMVKTTSIYTNLHYKVGKVIRNADDANNIRHIGVEFSDWNGGHTLGGYLKSKSGHYLKPIDLVVVSGTLIKDKKQEIEDLVDKLKLIGNG